MEPTTMVVAVLLAMTSAETLTLVAPPAQMPIEQCLEQAAQVNADPNTPYIMLCGPIIGEPALES